MVGTVATAKGTPRLKARIMDSSFAYGMWLAVVINVGLFRFGKACAAYAANTARIYPHFGDWGALLGAEPRKDAGTSSSVPGSFQPAEHGHKA